MKIKTCTFEVQEIWTGGLDMKLIIEMVCEVAVSNLGYNNSFYFFKGWGVYHKNKDKTLTRIQEQIYT